MFYVPGFTALLLLKTGEPTGFGITIEFLMLASAASHTSAPLQGLGSAQDVPFAADTFRQPSRWSQESLVQGLLSLQSTAL